MKVQERSPKAQAMVAQWELIDRLLGGTTAMREAGQTYMPKRRLESDEDYRARLSKATLLPAFSETVKKMTGRVFAEPLLVTGAPDWMETEVLKDVDRQGRTMHTWARGWFDEALAFGLSHVLVDSPTKPQVATVTREDQRRAGVRPYLVKISPRDVLGWRYAGNKLVQLRIASSRTEDDGEYGERIVPRVLVYEIGLCRVFEPVNKEPGADYVEVDKITMELDRIPLVTLYTNRTGDMTAAPPLMELAHLNVKHWQSQSSIDNLLDTATVPILTVIGVTEGDEILIGAAQAVRLPKDGKLEYCEHTGAAINTGRESLKDLLESMQQAGAKLLERRSGGGEAKTEVQVTEESSNEHSDLGDMVLHLEQALNEVLQLIASYRSAESGGTADVRPNLEPEKDPVAVVNALLSLHRDGIVSRPTVFQTAQQLGFVPEEITWADEQVRINEEGGTGAGTGAGSFGAE